MTKFPHDQFAKDYLQELLSPLGEVETSKNVTAEVREIDVFFKPTSGNREYVQNLGLLGQMAATVAIIEPFRNPVKSEGIFSGVAKLLNIRAEVLRKAQREGQRLEPAQLPFLWILTPTASEALLNSFGFQMPPESEGWGRGVYFLSEVWRVGLIAIHQLANVPETLWLRMLGRGRVQQQAITQLSQLPVDNPLRMNALELLYNLQANLQANLVESPEGDREDRELVMAIAPLFQEQLQAAKQQGREEGRQEGKEEGRQEQQRLILENLCQAKFGELDEKLTAFFLTISTCSAAEFTSIVLSISQLPNDDEGRQQARRLLAENVLNKREYDLGERLPFVVTSLLDLSVEELRSFLERIPQLTQEDLMNLLGQR